MKQSKNTVKISHADSGKEPRGFAELTRQYLKWDLEQFAEISGISLDLNAYLSNTLDNLDDYTPPNGRLVMAQNEADQLVGIVLLRCLEPGSGEIKRFFVASEARGHGIGEKLVEYLLREAREIGYRRLFLDTAHYMPEAGRLYRKVGFTETGPYPGSENDDAVKKFLVFMKMDL